MLFSTLLIAASLSVVACASNVTRPKYIVFSDPSSRGQVTAFGSRLIGTQSIGEDRFHFVSDLTADELKRLNGSVAPNARVKVNWHQQRIIKKSASEANSQFPYLRAENVNMYIVDTGIDLSHPEFRTNNRIWGGNFAGDGIDKDCDGHGTHVASLASGEQYGVARRTNLIAVKVLDCEGSGYYSDIIDSLTWVVNHAKSTNNQKRSIINMSLGGPYNNAFNKAVKAVRSQGIYVVVAAGNEGDDACNASPAAVTQAITVAASDSGDTRAPWSNYGECVDVYAPGVGLTAAIPNNQVATYSGTSMASPVAAGILAVHLSRNTNHGLSRFTSAWVNNVIKNNPKETPNKFVYLDPRL